MLQKKYSICIIIISNVIIGICALALGKWAAMRLFKSDPAIESCQKSMQAGSGAISARAFAFDYDIATGNLDSIEFHIHKESVEHSLKAVLSQYRMTPKQKSSVLLKRYETIKGGTLNQINMYRRFLLELDLATTHGQKAVISKKIDKILGKAETDCIVDVFGVVY